MSEPALISPLLDGFVMGDPISDHDGVRCCPAMELETDKKYIVKVISIPAKQEKLAALMLAGAFSDRESAIAYFKELADDVIQEADLLQKLSRFEGFIPYEKWQLVPMDPEAGYDVYLLSGYRPTLRGQLERNDMTHLAAVNLGLDLCAALSVCRRFGYIYADLQPSNVYICSSGEYRIGDLGFISLASLPYASLPEKYHSAFTPPEISDAYSALNETMDTYAVGMILYMAYNDGQLPEPGDVLHAPKHADHELATIIMKACDQNPDARWQDPMQMGQALINYLQRNSVNDTPIVPPPVPEEPEVVEEAETDESADPLDTAEVIAQVDEALDSVQAPVEDAIDGDAPEEAAETEATVEAAPAEMPEEVPAEAEIAEKATEAPEEASNEEAVAAPDEEVAEAPVDAADEEAAAATDEETPNELTEETGPEAACESEAEEDVEAEATVAQSETEQMLAQADELIAHELPSPVIPPEPIEVTLPVPQEPVPEATADIERTEAADEAPEQPDPEAEQEPATEGEEAPADAAEETEPAPEAPTAPPAKKRSKGLIVTLICGVLLLAALLGGYLFYKEYYLQSIDVLTLSGSEDRLTVRVDTDADQALLTILCTDTYGTTQRADVVDGIATFEKLSAGMNYRIQVRMDGFHQLTGTTTASYTTAQLTTISDFNAAIGTEDGSVILSFTVQGPDSQQWALRYGVPGDQEEPEQTVRFTGHMVTITGLTVGKEYSFTLEPVSSLYVSGETSLSFVPTNVITAQELQILGFRNGALQIAWSVPEGETVKQWSVRCYNDSYDQTMTTQETSVSFPGLDNAASYTIEVTADGMSVNSRTFLSAGSVTLQDIQMDATQSGSLKLSWTYEGIAPDGGWLVLYSVDGLDTQVIQCADAEATIFPLVPGGSYTISIQGANGATTFAGECSYQASPAASFSGYGITTETISLKMCVTPSKANWDRWDVKDSDFTTSFGIGVSASFTMRLLDTYATSDDEIVALYIIRDADGALISTATESRSWTSMWYRSRGKLTVPFMPEVPGDYTVEIYFNFALVTTQAFTVTQ